MRKTFTRAAAILLAAALLIPSGWLAPDAAAADAKVTEIYHETFANGKGVAAQSGGASLTPVTGKVFDGGNHLRLCRRS